jgi:hypothetical protein
VPKELLGTSSTTLNGEQEMEMKETSHLERQKRAVLKAYRTAIRLKYSLMADDEIARTLPDVERKMNMSILRGEPLQLNPGSVFFEGDK